MIGNRSEAELGERARDNERLHGRRMPASDFLGEPRSQRNLSSEFKEILIAGNHRRLMTANGSISWLK
jgi:hypothetical protein